MMESVSKQQQKKVRTEEELRDAAGVNELRFCSLVRGLLSTVLGRNAGTVQGLPQTKYSVLNYYSEQNLVLNICSFILSVISLSGGKCSAVLIVSKY